MGEEERIHLSGLILHLSTTSERRESRRGALSFVGKKENIERKKRYFSSGGGVQDRQRE